MNSAPEDPYLALVQAWHAVHGISLSAAENQRVARAVARLAQRFPEWLATAPDDTAVEVDGHDRP